MASDSVPCFLTTPNGARFERSCVMAFGHSLALFYDDSLVRDRKCQAEIKAVAINRNRIFSVLDGSMEVLTYDLVCVSTLALVSFAPTLMVANDVCVLMIEGYKAVSLSLKKSRCTAMKLNFEVVALHSYGDTLVGRLADGQIKVL